MKRENAQKMSLPRPALLAGAGVLIVVLVVLLLWLGGGKAANKTAGTMDIKTTYVTLKYPKDYKKYLQHREILEGSDAIEVFSMVSDGVEAELFRLSFTAAEPESVEGYLLTDNGMLYISLEPNADGVDLSSLMQDGEETDKSRKVESIYYAMMGGMGQVLESVQEDSRYSIVKEVAKNDKRTDTVLNWKVSLPKAITWQTSEDDGIQEAVFRAAVGEKEITLYTVALEDIATENAVGQYTRQGQTKYVTVTISDLDAQDPLTEDELAAVHLLMDSVNDVLQVISSDANFSSTISDVE